MAGHRLQVRRVGAREAGVVTEAEFHTLSLLSYGDVGRLAKGIPQAISAAMHQLAKEPIGKEESERKGNTDCHQPLRCCEPPPGRNRARAKDPEPNKEQQQETKAK